MNVAISGFGRIGRNFLRVVISDAYARKHITIKAINIGPAAIEHTAHFFTYDTLMGTYPGTVTQDKDYLVVDGVKIKLIAQADPLAIDWRALNIDWVVDASGKFTNGQQAGKHLKSGAGHVLITAPAHDEDVTIVPGVNEEKFNQDTHHIVSLGSCTTNAFIPLIKIVHDTFGIVQGAMTTVHSYTNSQVLLDVDGPNLRRARAAALNIIPTETGASDMVAKFFPDLGDVISACSLRVPVGKVSLIDFSFMTRKTISVDMLHKAIEHASQDRMKGIVRLIDIPLVSSDFSGDSYSVIVDGLLTNAQGTFGTLYGWYDNEWGYSVRLKDFLTYVQTGTLQAEG